MRAARNPRTFAAWCWWCRSTRKLFSLVCVWAGPVPCRCWPGCSASYRSSSTPGAASKLCSRCRGLSGSVCAAQVPASSVTLTHNRLSWARIASSKLVSQFSTQCLPLSARSHSPRPCTKSPTLWRSAGWTWSETLGYCCAVERKLRWGRYCAGNRWCIRSTGRWFQVLLWCRHGIAQGWRAEGLGTGWIEWGLWGAGIFLPGAKFWVVQAVFPECSGTGVGLGKVNPLKVGPFDLEISSRRSRG